MPLTRLHDLAVGLIEKIVTEPKRFGSRARNLICSWICSNPNNSAQRQRGHSETRIALHYAGEP